MHSILLVLYVANASRAITYRASTHVQQLSDNQQRRLEAETTHEREERLQQLSAARLEAETTHEREERLQQLSAAQVRS